MYNISGNTGLNPVSEIWYGSTTVENKPTLSRLLFYFDLSNIKQKFIEKEIVSGATNVRHTLKMFNTISLDKQFLGKTTADHKTRASSFDLVLYRLDEEWDSGAGYTFPNPNSLFKLDMGVKNAPSNWFERKTNTKWENEGGVLPCITWGSVFYTFNQLQNITFANACPIIAQQHFDLGNENLEMDITDDINDMILSGINRGYVLAYHPKYENLIYDAEIKTVGFFTNKTEDFFEPFLETSWENTINDNRNSFYLDRSNKLYLYVNQNGNLKNLDIIPSGVTIFDNDSQKVASFSGNQITQSSKGVYYVNYTPPSYALDKVIYQDRWEGLFLDGRKLSDVTLDFTLKNPTNFFETGPFISDSERYDIATYGILDNENIVSGDKRKIVVRVTKKYEKNIVFDEIKYRIYVTEGKDQIDIIPYSNVHLSNNLNYFDLDTSWLLPREYFIQIKINRNGVEFTEPKTIRFNVIQVI